MRTVLQEQESKQSACCETQSEGLVPMFYTSDRIRKMVQMVQMETGGRGTHP